MKLRSNMRIGNIEYRKFKEHYKNKLKTISNMKEYDDFVLKNKEIRRYFSNKLNLDIEEFMKLFVKDYVLYRYFLRSLFKIDKSKHLEYFNKYDLAYKIFEDKETRTELIPFIFEYIDEPLNKFKDITLVLYEFYKLLKANGLSSDYIVKYNVQFPISMLLFFKEHNVLDRIVNSFKYKYYEVKLYELYLNITHKEKNHILFGEDIGEYRLYYYDHKSVKNLSVSDYDVMQKLKDKISIEKIIDINPDLREIKFYFAKKENQLIIVTRYYGKDILKEPLDKRISFARKIVDEITKLWHLGYVHKNPNLSCWDYDGERVYLCNFQNILTVNEAPSFYKYTSKLAIEHIIYELLLPKPIENLLLNYLNKKYKEYLI